MTEEDTFNRLKRTPFRQLLVSVLDNVTLGEDIVPLKNKSRIEAAGWDFSEFRNMALQDLADGNLCVDISKIHDTEWQKWYLSLPVVY